ncbi:MAG: hypothetical protein K0S10_3196 [Rubrobacteraceae bacterium]|nr:hypothetical protein [Rubrobacteraceae bacterium]
MKIHAIRIGTVALTTKSRKAVGHGRRRPVNAVPEDRPAPRLSL